MIAVSIFPFCDEWIPDPTNGSIEDWVKKVPHLPVELRTQFLPNFTQDRLLFTKWFHFCQYRLSLVTEPGRDEIRGRILRDLIPESWTFKHLRQFSCKEGDLYQQQFIETQISIARNVFE